MADELVDALLSWAHTYLVPLGVPGLFILAFAESSFFPIPPDAVLIPLSLLNPGGALLYGLTATAGSVLGALLGYWIGLRGGRPVLLKIIKEERVMRVEGYFNRYGLWAVGIAAFTPIPYKVFTIASGAFRLRNIKGFIIVSFIGRGARFMTEATLIMLYGEPILEFIRTYFEQLTIAVVAAAAVIYVAYRRLGRKNKNRNP